MTKELEGRLSSLLGLGLLLGPLERSIGIARELLAGRHAALFGTRWSGLHPSYLSPVAAGRRLTRVERLVLLVSGSARVAVSGSRIRRLVIACSRSKS